MVWAARGLLFVATVGAGASGLLFLSAAGFVGAQIALGAFAGWTSTTAIASGVVLPSFASSIALFLARPKLLVILDNQMRLAHLREEGAEERLAIHNKRLLAAERQKSLRQEIEDRSKLLDLELANKKKANDVAKIEASRLRGENDVAEQTERARRIKELADMDLAMREKYDY